MRSGFNIGRRLFLKLFAVIVGLGGGWAALRAVFTSRGTIDEWTDLGPVDAAPVDSPEERAVHVTERLGWLSRTVEKGVWLRRAPEGDLRVFSAACPHEACVIHKDVQSKGFICLCHRSRFDLDGRVLNGPALRGMDSLEHEVKGGALWVRYRKFKKQLRVKEVVS
jgi:Rieske Fe-S protein